MSSRRRKSPRLLPTAERLEPRSLLTTYTVTSAADAGPGTLRQAITDANANPGGDAVAFNIGTFGLQTIHLLSPLPAVAPGQPLKIDGGTQPGSGGPQIALDGSAAGATATGLELDADSCVVHGIAIGNFGGIGLDIRGSGNFVDFTFVGVSPDGGTARPNGTGIQLSAGASNNLIGKTAISGDGNIISGNTGNGVLIAGPATNTNLIAGNFIGVNVTGEQALPNGQSGVVIRSGEGNVVGGMAPSQRNVISGNLGDGVGLESAQTGRNSVQGNYVGTDAGGEQAIPNASYGIAIASANNLVGGNLISGNKSLGVSISGTGAFGNQVSGNTVGLDALGRAAIPNLTGVELFAGASGNFIGDGSSTGRNVVSGNTQDGVAIVDANTFGNFVQNNYLGTNPGGTAAIPNGYRGVDIFGGSSGNTVGGPYGYTGNLISGNTFAGVDIGNAGVGNALLGNIIGLDKSGAVALPNRGGGVIVTNTLKTVIGDSAADRNVISGNAGTGISLNGSSITSIQANLIGTDAAGAVAIGNQGLGISLQGSNWTTVGGATGNLISGNMGTGVDIGNSAYVSVVGNRIGSDTTGKRPLGNAGTAGPADGIAIFSTNHSMVAYNEVVANAYDGITIGSSSQPAGATNSIYNNLIGTDAAGDPGLGNKSNGVNSQGFDNIIPAPDQLFGNTIANNGNAGVAVGAGGNLLIYNNTIYGNVLPGISLFPANDVPPRSLPNNNQAAPTLTSAASGAVRTLVAGTLDSLPSTSYQLIFYSTPVADPSGHGGAVRTVGGFIVTTDAAGHASFRSSLSSPVVPGQLLTATAARADGTTGTSQFAANVVVAAASGSQGASTLADFDGDGSSDLALYRPTTGQWFLAESSSGQQIVGFGQPGVDVPVSGDFDGDGKADLAVYRPNTGQWLIQPSSATARVVSLGGPGDIPVPADYDGDGKTDLAVYRPSTGQWFIQRSTAGPEIVQFGGPGDQPVPGDYDGVGKADIAVYRKATGQWLILGATAGARAVSFGAPNLDVPIPADYDGDGKTDLAVYRPTTSQWLIMGSSTGPRLVQFGAPGLDQPVPADYDGDGKADLAVYRKSTGQWLILGSSTGPRVVSYGLPGVDVPVASPLAYRYQGAVSAQGVRINAATAPKASTAGPRLAAPVVAGRRRLVDAGDLVGRRHR